MQQDKFTTILAYACCLIMLITGVFCIAAAVAGVLAWGSAIVMVFVMFVTLIATVHSSLG